MSSNLNKPHTGPELLNISVRLYFSSFPKTFFISALFIVLIALISQNNMLFTFLLTHLDITSKEVIASYREHFTLLIMLLGIALIPVLGTLLTLYYLLIEKRPAKVIHSFLFVCSRFLTIAGVLISMSLLPLIVLSLGFVAHFALIYFSAPHIVLFFSPYIIYGLILMLIVRKNLAIISIFSEKHTANQALETSILMIKGYYWRGLLYAAFGLSILLFIINIPDMLHFYFPHTKITPIWVWDTVVLAGLFLVVPWLCALWVCHERDCHYRYIIKTKNNQENKEICQDFKAKVTLNKEGDQHRGF